ncbi:hypothetical protein [Prevotella sp. C561]|uniref:hypothetical protein n=1 Tax=Prevotella sp. C561 TaxID=563031 RepID=UPI0018DCAD82|nr:hypothetical protein [Prevotella sp. C561]
MAENTTRRCGDFPDKPSGLGPWESHKPRTTFADKKGTASVSLSSHIVEHRKRSESATLVVENRKGGYLNMRDNHLMKSNGKFLQSYAS